MSVYDDRVFLNRIYEAASVISGENEDDETVGNATVNMALLGRTLVEIGGLCDGSRMRMIIEVNPQDGHQKGDLLVQVGRHGYYGLHEFVLPIDVRSGDDIDECADQFLTLARSMQNSAVALREKECPAN